MALRFCRGHRKDSVLKNGLENCILTGVGVRYRSARESK